MKKEVMRRDLFGRDTCFVMGIYPTENRGEQCRALCPVGCAMGAEQGWLEHKINGSRCGGDTPVLGLQKEEIAWWMDPG